METYKLFTKNPIKAIEDIIIYSMPHVFGELATYLERENKIASKKSLLDNIGLFASRGLMLLREKGQDDKQFYELFYGCILAAFLNAIENNFVHEVFYPEDESYDFLITQIPREKRPDFKLRNKEIYKKMSVLKVELTEAINVDSIKSAILNKLDPAHDYKGRILLVSMTFVEGYVNFRDLSNDMLRVDQDNFQTIWLFGQTPNPHDSKKSCFLIAELLKHKRIFPLFELLIDWNRIKAEINQVLLEAEHAE